ncbi:MAG TPA: hypothetical protein PKZ39_00745, partial [Clostridia bacterium]|nr:hypothetical protein [Clostridia bacterium]
SNARIDLNFDGETGGTGDGRRQAARGNGSVDFPLPDRVKNILDDVEKRLDDLGESISRTVESSISRALGRQGPDDGQG